MGRYRILSSSCVLFVGATALVVLLMTEGSPATLEADPEETLVDVSDLAPPTPSRLETEGEPIGPPEPKVARVVIDAGHGGSDPGAVGMGGLQEKDVTLAIAQELKRILAQWGNCTVLLTRNAQDIEWPDRARAGFAKSNRADLFLSIHTGASFAPAARGFEIFYSGESPRGTPRFAQTILEALAKATSAPCRGVHETPCRVVAEADTVGLLIEVGCITNSEEEPLLASADYKRRIAEGLAQGIRDYLAPEES